MPDTAKEYGVTDPMDVAQSARGAAKYLTALGSEFHHDWAKAVAGYNAGGGAVETAVSRHGADWLKHMPAETQKYVAEVLGGM
jgi:soluble lytic murein transglycosylase-like protein